jgi:hypothetical protein
MMFWANGIDFIVLSHLARFENVRIRRDTLVLEEEDNKCGTYFEVKETISWITSPSSF